MNNILSFYENLIYRSWTVKKPRYILLAIHGIGAHSERWRDMAEYLLKKNISTYALELRGSGDNHLHCPVYSFQKFHQDIHVLKQLIRVQYPKTKIILSGESMGGLISFDYATQDPALDGLICLSPAFKNLIKFKWYEYLLMPLILFFPYIQIKMHFSAQMCTVDKKVQQAMKNDPRETRKVPGGLLLAILFTQLRSIFSVKKLNIPVLFQLAGKDVMVSTAKSKAVHKKIKSRKEIIVYPKLHHALSIEKNRNIVFRDTYFWLEQL